MSFLAICKHCKSQLKAELESISAQSEEKNIAATPVTLRSQIGRHDLTDSCSTNEVAEVR